MSISSINVAFRRRATMQLGISSHDVIAVVAVEAIIRVERVEINLGRNQPVCSPRSLEFDAVGSTDTSDTRNVGLNARGKSLNLAMIVERGLSTRLLGELMAPVLKLWYARVLEHIEDGGIAVAGDLLRDANIVARGNREDREVDAVIVYRRRSAQWTWKG